MGLRELILGAFVILAFVSLAITNRYEDGRRTELTRPLTAILTAVHLK